MSRYLLVSLCICCAIAGHSQSTFPDNRIIVQNGDWELVGDLMLPSDEGKFPTVLMLNKANGNREVYKELAGLLAERGMASLRLDLRGHGESTNVDEFVPGEVSPNPLIWDSEVDVVAAVNYLKEHPHVFANRIAVIGGSYSGEEMAEAGRIDSYVNAYVALSPGSFSDESIVGIDESGVPWLFVVSRDERHLKEIQAEVQRVSKTVELIVIPGTQHATRLLPERPELAEWIAVWLETVL